VWLNNCVGRQNIAAFYALLAGTAGQMLTQIVVGAYGIYVYTTPAFALRAQAYFPAASPLGVLVVIVVAWVLAIAVEGLVVQLLSFHGVLVARDLTTYDFIVQRGQERQGVEIVPGYGSSLGTWLRGYRKAVEAPAPPSPPPQEQPPPQPQLELRTRDSSDLDQATAAKD